MDQTTLQLSPVRNRTFQKVDPAETAESSRLGLLSRLSRWHESDYAGGVFGATPMLRRNEMGYAFSPAAVIGNGRCVNRDGKPGGPECPQAKPQIKMKDMIRNSE